MGPRAAFVVVPLLLLLTAVFLPARDTVAPYLVRDLNTATGSSSLGELIPVGDAVLFRRGTSTTSQLWRSDGTAARTTLIHEGSRWPGGLTVVGGTAFFTTGDALWKLDDRTGKPTHIKNVAAQALTAADDLLFFGARHEAGCELWRSDGSEQGTFPVVIVPISCWEPVNESLFFLGRGASGYEIWHSDGTAEGTSRLASGLTLDLGLYPVVVNDTLFFTIRENSVHQLWKSDGTPEGTEHVTSLSGSVPWTDEFPSARAGNLLFFAACRRDYAALAVCDLWRTDGTAEGTVAVARFTPPLDRSENEWSLPHLVGLGNLALFSNDNDGCDELWRSDGTLAGTMRLGAFCAALGWRSGVSVGDRLFFSARTPETGLELWSTDGSEAGTRLVADIDPGPGSGFAFGLSADEVSGTVYLAGQEPTTGSELWRSDGTAEGTELVADINPGPGSSRPAEVVRAGEQLFLVATGPGGSRELWRTDGTAAGTREVADLTTSAASSEPEQFTDINGHLFFVASDVDETGHLWVSDGSEDGTVKLTESPASAPSRITHAGRLVFFTRFDPRTWTGEELWRSDGTTTGTFRLADIAPRPGSSHVESLIDVEGTLFFTAEDVDGVPELWKSDGTVNGTVLVTRFDTHLRFRGLTAVGGRLFFLARGWPNDDNLWSSDGTAEGTRLVRDLPVGHYEDFAELDGAFFFTSVSYYRRGRDLWRSDGTTSGTRVFTTMRGTDSRTLVRTPLGDAFLYGVGSSLWRFNFATGTAEHVAVIAPSFFRPTRLDAFTNVNGTVFLRAREVNAVTYSTGRVELWATGGTTATTARVAVLPDGAQPSSFTNVYGTLMFVLDGAIWKSDGTPEGTGPVTDPELSVLWMTHASGSLFFSASEPTHGRELWALPLCASGPPCTTERCDGVDCADDDPCTVDSCSLDTGCVHTRLPGCPRTVIPVSTTTTTLTGSTSSSLGTTTSSTSTTTSSTTTSTVPCPLGPQGSCDDGDPCTEDRCTPAGCRHAPRLGLDAVRCRFTGESHQPPACDSERIPASVTVRLDEAERLIKRAARLDDRRAARQQAQKALRLLRNAAREARQVDEDQAAISGPCADALARRIQDTRTQALRWFLGIFAR